MWECQICGSENEDEDTVCVNCGSLKLEPTYDIESDLQDEEVEEDP